MARPAYALQEKLPELQEWAGALRSSADAIVEAAAEEDPARLETLVFDRSELLSHIRARIADTRLNAHESDEIRALWKETVAAEERMHAALVRQREDVASQLRELNVAKTNAGRLAEAYVAPEGQTD